MKAPAYVGKQADDMQEIDLGDGSSLQLIFGQHEGVEGSFSPSFPIWMGTLFLASGASFERAVPQDEAIFFYVVKGKVNVNEQVVEMRNLVEFEHAGELVFISAAEDAIVIFGHAKPFNEPIVAQGPFVMNSQEQIQEAYRDYQMGKFA
jgi:redox-sensitive bicupin YhaK (pirin superfamily)